MPGILEDNSLSKQDSGNYTCTVSNSVGTIQRSAYITVLGIYYELWDEKELISRLLIIVFLSFQGKNIEWPFPSHCCDTVSVSVFIILIIYVDGTKFIYEPSSGTFALARVNYLVCEASVDETLSPSFTWLVNGMQLQVTTDFPFLFRSAYSGNSDPLRLTTEWNTCLLNKVHSSSETHNYQMQGSISVLYKLLITILRLCLTHLSLLHVYTFKYWVSTLRSINQLTRHISCSIIARINLSSPKSQVKSIKTHLLCTNLF